MKNFFFQGHFGLNLFQGDYKSESGATGTQEDAAEDVCENADDAESLTSVNDVGKATPVKHDARVGKVTAAKDVGSVSNIGKVISGKLAEIQNKKDVVNSPDVGASPDVLQPTDGAKIDVVSNEDMNEPSDSTTAARSCHSSNGESPDPCTTPSSTTPAPKQKSAVQSPNLHSALV